MILTGPMHCLTTWNPKKRKRTKTRKRTRTKLKVSDVLFTVA